MTDQEIKDIIKKGGPGSGRKGHTGVTPDKSTRERNRLKAGEAIQTSRDAKRIIAELDLGKEDLKEIRDYASAEGITPSQFIVNNKDHIKSNFNNKKDEAHDLMSQMKAPGVGSMAKGGPGSGKKGSKHDASAAMTDNRRANTEKYLKQLKTSLSLERDPAAKADFEKDIKDIEAELKMNKSYDEKIKDTIRKGGPGSGKKGSKHDAEVEAKEKEEHGASLKDKFANLQSTWDKMNKGPLVTAARSALRSPGAGKGSDKVPGGPGGPSAAAGGGTGKGTGGSMPMISKGGPGSGRRGHFTEDGEDHTSVLERDPHHYGSSQEKLIDKEKFQAAADREEERAKQRIRERESSAKRGVSRKRAPANQSKKDEKPSWLQRVGQKIIDAI